MKSQRSGNPFNCPLTASIHAIGGRWKPLIIYNLANGPRRFGQLGSLVPLISKKVLTEQLKQLENDVIIKRTSTVQPRQVAYALTDQGLTVLPLLEKFCEWGTIFQSKLTDQSV